MNKPRPTMWKLSGVLTVLLGCGLLAAQDAKLPDTSGPGSKIQSASQSAAQNLNKFGPIEVLTDTQGVDFGPYLQDILSKVRQNWYAIIPADAQTKRGKLAIEFAIQKDGRIVSMRLVAPSGDLSLDRAAWGGITASNPLPALPTAFTGLLLALRFRFYYNPDKSDLEGMPPPAPAPAPATAPATPSILCSRPHKTTSRVEAETLGDPLALNLEPYLENSVLPILRANWYRLVSKSAATDASQMTIEFTIQKDGSLGPSKLTDSAGDPGLGELAVKGIEESGPFPALPAEFGGPSLSVRSHFFFEPDPNGAASSRGRANARNEETPAFARPCTPDEITKGAVDCMVPPKPTYSPEPDFSPEARKQKKQGVVTVWVVVAHDGSVQSACVNQSIGYGLDEQAVDAVRFWKFLPATFNGQPMATKLLVEVDFHLYEKEQGSFLEGLKALAAADPAISPSGLASQDVKPPDVKTADQASAKVRIVPINKGVTTPPRVIFSPAPESAQDTRTTKYSGTAILQLTVTTEGNAENIKILQSLGPELDQKAIEAVRKWKFEPAMRDGEPVAVKIAVEVDFHLY